MYLVGLKELREKQKIKQWQVAEVLGISRTTYTNIENGKKETDFENLVKLAKYFKVSTDFLLGISDNPRKEEDKGLEELREDLAHNSELKALFDLGKKAKPEDVEFVINFFKRVSRKCGED